LTVFCDADAALLAELEKRKKRAERFEIPLADTAVLKASVRQEF
jgi:hypothetical protein